MTGDATTDIIQATTQGDEGDWPGMPFETTTDAGTALLGSPNGWGVGYMVAQHNQELGGKVVDRVVVFSDLFFPFPNIAFHIGKAGGGGSR